MNIERSMQNKISQLETISLPEKYSLSIAAKDDIAEIKALDDLAFAQHQGITKEEIEQIIDNGKLILLRDANGRLVGESQVVFKQIPCIKHLLADNEACIYGNAIHPEKQREGLSHEMEKAERLLAKEAGKNTMVLTTRAENDASLRSRFKQGYAITGFDPEYYGKLEEGGARVIMKAKIDSDIPSKEYSRQLKEKDITEFNGENLENDFLSIQVNFGDKVDIDANTKISKLIDSGYKGVWLFRENELKDKGSKEKGIFIFEKKQ